MDTNRSKQIKTLIFGPWIGEFGWELFECVPYLRNKAKKYNQVICAGIKSRRILYEDFCHKFYEFKDFNRKKSDCWTNPDFDMKSYNIFLDKFKIENFDIISPGERITGKKEFIQFGRFHKNLEYDVIIHMRNRDSVGIERNWKSHKWDRHTVKKLWENYLK